MEYLLILLGFVVGVVFAALVVWNWIGQEYRADQIEQADIREARQVREN